MSVPNPELTKSNTSQATHITYEAHLVGVGCVILRANHREVENRTL